jgi:ketosteroid isomerase-like protein
MLTEDNARDLASHWIRVWNTHDLDEIMSHYGEDVFWYHRLSQRF